MQSIKKLRKPLNKEEYFYSCFDAFHVAGKCIFFVENIAVQKVIKC